MSISSTSSPSTVASTIPVAIVARNYVGRRSKLWRSHKSPAKGCLGDHLSLVVIAVILFLRLGGHTISADEQERGPIGIFVWEVTSKFFVPTGMGNVTLRGDLIEGIRERGLHYCGGWLLTKSDAGDEESGRDVADGGEERKQN